MKKIYAKILLVLALLLHMVPDAKGQCSIPLPTISGNTLVCGANGIFTLTATGQSTLTTWYVMAPNTQTVATGSVFTTPSLTSTTTYYASQSAAVASTSLTMPSQGSIYPGNTRGYWFTAPSNFTITGLRVPTDASMANSNVAVVNFGNTPPPLFPTFTNAFTLLYLGQNIPGTGTITVNIPIIMGDIIGVLGDRGGNNSYAIGPVPSTLGGMGVTLERLGMQYVMGTTSPQDLWTEPAGSNISRVELYADGACTTSMVPVTVVVSNPPQVSVAGPASALCSGATSTTLMASGASSYTWVAGPNTTTLGVAPNTTTTYSVTGSNSYGCTNMATYQVIVAPLPPVTIISSTSVLCVGKSATLTLSGALTYTWNTGFNNPVLVVNPNTTTTYSVTGTDANGCVGAYSLQLPVSPIPTVNINVANTIICAGQSTTLTATGTGASSYTWSSGATTNSIVVVPTTPTSYTAVGTNTAGCSKSAVVSLVVIICTSISENNGDGTYLQAYPNPSDGFINVQSSKPIRQVQLIDLSGRTVLEQNFDALTEIRLDLTGLGSGVYFIEFPKDDVGKRIKVVKE